MEGLFEFSLRAKEGKKEGENEGVERQNGFLPLTSIFPLLPRGSSHLSPGPRPPHRVQPDGHLPGEPRPRRPRQLTVLDPERPPFAQLLVQRPEPHHPQRDAGPAPRLPATLRRQPGLSQPRGARFGRILPLCRQ